MSALISFLFSSFFSSMLCLQIYIFVLVYDVPIGQILWYYNRSKK